MNDRVDLGYRPRAWQAECHKRKARFTVLALHRRAGKTELAIMELVDKALRCQLPLPMFFYIAPFLKQAKAIAWARLKERIRPLEMAGVCEISESDLMVTFSHNKAVIRIYGADNPDAMRGVRLDGCVIDEVAQIKPEVWNDIIQPALSDRRGWALFIGTPAGVNLFSELFYRAQSLTDWHSALYTVYDTESIAADEVERLKRDMPETAFQREYLCDFTAAGDMQLISLAEVHDAAGRHMKITDYQYSPRVLGVDPARFGDDRSVIFPRQGLSAFPPLVFKGMDNMDLASRVIQKAVDWQADAIFIDAGNGSGVIDRIRQLGHDCVEVWFGGKSSDVSYHDKRTEIWCEMAGWLRMGGAIPNDVALKQDLAGPTYKFDHLGRKWLESKDELKKRGLPSPDLGDALALTFSSPVAPRGREGELIPGMWQKKRNDNYDPYKGAI
jgi:hypothetical protein